MKNAHDPSLAVMDLPRRDARDKLRGRTRYTVDQAGPEVLHAVLLRATVASARITRLDVTPALTMAGVHAIATHRDAPGLHGIGIADHPIFASDTVRYHGEPLAVIAAETLALARRAANAVIVEYEAMPPVLTLQAALAPDARLVHPSWESYEVLHPGATRGGNIAWEARVDRGDTEAAFARDDVTIVEGTYDVGRQNHLSFEPRAVIASYEDGRFHIQTSTQAPWTVKHVVARVLEVPESAVRVTVPAVGGGFGLKFDCSLEPYAAILARKSGRAVSLVNSRREEMMTCLCRENAEIHIRSAIDAEGEIVAREASVLMDCGAYGGEQVFLTTMTAHTLAGNYRLGAAKIVTRAVYTNTPPNGAFRACNGVYNTFALERHTDEICAAIGMDPFEFRRRNVIGDGDIGATGQTFQGDVLAPMLDRMVDKYPVERRSGRLRDGRLYGRATTVGTWFIFVGPSAATVNLNADGSATLVTAGVEIGSGTMMQSLPQIVAANLGIHPDAVIVKTADTDAAGRDLGVGGGRTTVSIGAASEAACAEVREKLLTVAARLLQTNAAALVLTNGRVEVDGKPGSGMTLKAVIAEAELTTGPIAGSGAFTAPGTTAMPGCATGHFIDAIDIPVFAVHDCEVAVDEISGRCEILSYRVVQDVGRALNRRAIHGQIQGGVVQGIGYALTEEVTIGPDGAVDQTGLESYRVPLAGDVLPIDFELYEGAPSLGPLGTKGAGEVPILNVAASLACAIANATGKPVTSLPMTPERIATLIAGEGATASRL
ncbi:xanthine dehydrogenase family protein molybdopterin-binding subunit [Sulfitobacter sp. PR48]|uniref:xanthine dehydrogenase family protein molybdopterin-binding subunit n=1 Tax=Sulfitobacter sp. PR48 TaxID=3028383 RepID=UPI00237B2876|nr:xanthine dehydrogenase family protein molybdopterin-binding subunit [Sulfitobacter sp. PR48]MDD9720574.1 xanthine dehydrogenase family protein molybdopterin-binding subunit [Sulfitobacter sp. PR48]